MEIFCQISVLKDFDSFFGRFFDVSESTSIYVKSAKKLF